MMGGMMGGMGMGGAMGGMGGGMGGMGMGGMMGGMGGGMRSVPPTSQPFAVVAPGKTPPPADAASQPRWTERSGHCLHARAG